MFIKLFLGYWWSIFREIRLSKSDESMGVWRQILTQDAISTPHECHVGDLPHAWLVTSRILLGKKRQLLGWWFFSWFGNKNNCIYIYIYICVLLVFPKTFLKHIWSQPHPNHPNLPFGHQLLHIPKSLNLLKTKGQRSNILKQICIWNFEAQNPQHSQDYDLKIEPSGKKNPNKIIQQIPPTSQISLVENDLWVEHPRQVPRRLVRPGLRLGRARGGWLLQRC